jgi:KUP system potassium uptake protein
LIAFVISFLMLTWRKGEELMDTVRLEIRERSQDFIDRIRRDPPMRIPGTAIVLGRMAKGVPLARRAIVAFPLRPLPAVFRPFVGRS